MGIVRASDDSCNNAPERRPEQQPENRQSNHKPHHPLPDIRLWAAPRSRHPVWCNKAAEASLVAGRSAAHGPCREPTRRRCQAAGVPTRSRIGREGACRLASSAGPAQTCGRLRAEVPKPRKVRKSSRGHATASRDRNDPRAAPGPRPDRGGPPAAATRRRDAAVIAALRGRVGALKLQHIHPTGADAAGHVSRQAFARPLVDNRQAPVARRRARRA